MALYFDELFIGPDTTANRPAVTDVAEGALYVNTDTEAVEICDGSTWTEWLDLAEPE